MIREVIVALAGFESELFVELEKCVDLKDFLHPSEQMMLRNILEFSRNYQFLKKVVDVNVNDFLSNEKTDFRAPSGLYVQAFCGGLDKALESYRYEILMLEQEALRNPTVGLTYIHSVIHNYVVAFSLLKSLSKQILLGRTRGCQILQMLYENMVHSVEDSKTYLKTILNRCYSVFLGQTMSWLMNGELTDPYDEYIIQRSSLKTDSVDESDSSTVTEQEGLMEDDFCENYKIAISYVPVFINYSLANDVLFVGQIVKILYENPRNCMVLKNVEENLVFRDKHSSFFEQFASLKSSEDIDVKKLEDSVHEIRTCVVEHLWKVAVKDKNLYDELELLKNVYLLGFGQFFNEFLSKASVFSLHLSRSQISQIPGLFSNLNKVLADSASTLLHTDEKMLSAFAFKFIPCNSKDVPNSADIVWSSIRLQYTPKWPLNLIFTPIAIEHYNKLFLFLLRVKRCHIEIHRIWKKDIKNKNRRFGKAWKLRNELMFLINNLLFYLQVDVIETEYNNLINESHKIKDFKQIEKLHNMFLLNVLSHSFLLDVPPTNSSSETVAPTTYSKHFYDMLLKNIRICEKFCLLASKGFENREEEISELNKNFQKYKYVFMCFLAEYQSQPFKQHAGKLLLRLDFNNWVHNSIVDVE